MTYQYFLGVDVSKESLDLFLQTHEGGFHNHVSNDEEGYEKLTQWLSTYHEHENQAQTHCCLEATGRYGENVCHHLYQLGYAVSVVNPKAIKKYAEAKMKRNKTDKLDAKLLAHYGERERPYLWHPSTKMTQILQAMTRHLSSLKENRTREVNRLKAGTHPDIVRTSLEDNIAFLSRQIQQLDQGIANHIRKNDELHYRQCLLTSIPGIGAVTASIILSELPTDGRLKNSKEVTAFAGMVPVHEQSGKQHLKKGFCKQGSKRLRNALYMAALSGMRFNPRLLPLVKRMRAEGKHNMKIIGACMRKLLVWSYGVLKSGMAFDPSHGIEQNLTLTWTI